MSRPPSESSRVLVSSHFIRQRNILWVQGSFGPLFEDYALHWLQHGIAFPQPMDRVLRQALAALALHLTSRPWREATAWTLNFQEPRFNLFVSGDSRLENVIGRVFLEEVREGDSNLFFAQVAEPDQPLRQSMTPFQGNEFLPIVESFQAQSEQRKIRFFDLGEDNFGMAAAQPDCDESWLAKLDAVIIRALPEIEVLSPLEKRWFRFHCGCTLERIAGTLASLSPSAQDHLFEEKAEIQVDCRRCGAVFPITRQALLAARQASNPDGGAAQPS